MVLNKRGVFFSLSALFFMAVLLYVFTSNYATAPIDTGEISVSTTNSYRERLENSYMPMLLRERSYTALYALSRDAENRNIVLSLPSDYQEAVMQGSYRGFPLPIAPLPAVLNNLSNASLAAGVNVSIAVQDISVRQIGAFQAIFEANYSYNLSSLDGTVRFNRDIPVFGTFFLFGIPDRYYNEQNPWGEELFVQQYRPASWNTSEFANMSAQRYYTANNESPSLFGRLTGNLSQSPYGIEVTIPQTVTPAGNLTSMDWQYFAGTGYSCTYRHAGVYPSLRLRFEDLAFYNLTGGSLAHGSAATCLLAP